MSEIVGNILTLGITVGLIVALFMLVSAQPAPTNPASVDAQIRTTDSTLHLSHTGGSSVDLDQGLARAVVDGSPVAHPLTDFSANASSGNPDLWELGERLCVSCHHAGSTISELTLILGQELAATWSGTVTVP